MEFKEISKRAIEIRKLYHKLEEEKYGRSWTREEIMEGFVGDVGDLIKLTMAKSGVREIENVDEKLAHELADCLWCVLVLSNKYNVDLEKEFMNTMDELENRIISFPPKKLQT
jgi:NTP pyrophosphatase (non-canonical NTP hydrolase)